MTIHFPIDELSHFFSFESSERLRLSSMIQMLTDETHTSRVSRDTVDADKVSGAVECIVCGGPLRTCAEGLTDTRFGIEGEYSLVQCRKCGLEQTRPIPSPHELKDLYEYHYNFRGERDTTYTSLREWFFFSPLYKLWLWLDGDSSFHCRKGEGRLLDVGCNEGRGLQLYKRNGFQAEGLELNDKAAATACKKGLTVYTSLLEHFRPIDMYDVVVLSNVLEHTADPKRMLFSAASVLKSQGEIWISCPNSESWLRDLFGSSWINWHVPFHIVHFSSLQLISLLQSSGFHDIRIQHVTPSLWVASSIITKACAKHGRITKELRNPFLVLGLMVFARLILFPFLWFGNSRNRGDCLLVTARKI